MDCRFDTTKAASIKPREDHGFPYDQTSSDTEVVGDLLLSAFAAERRDEIPQSEAPSV
jgi:hypothetical protein